MHFPEFQNAYFLQSIGWAIINSIWQFAALWIVYELLVINHPKISALAKYNLSLTLLFSGSLWFIITIYNSYHLFQFHPFTPFGRFDHLNILSQTQFISIIPWISTVYFILMTVYFIRFCYQLFNIHILKEAPYQKSTIDIRLFVNKSALQFGYKKKINTWISEQIDVPTVIGYTKPIILLPLAIINNLSTEQLEAVLLHEVAHIIRRDYLINSIQSIVMVSLFFNPFAILLNRIIKKERENCCDDIVLNHQFDTSEYAKALFILEEQRQLKVQLALAATNGKKKLFLRIKRIIAYQPSEPLNLLQKIQAGLLLFIILLGISTIKPTIISLQLKRVTINNPAWLTPIEQPISREIASTKLNSATTKENNQQYKKNTLKKTDQLINKKEIKYPTNNDNYAIIFNQTEPTKNAFASNQPTEKSYVKIEEEVSGQRNKKIYYIQIDQKNGTTSVKPLLFLNQQTKIVIDSTNKNIAKPIELKKGSRRPI